MTLPGRTSTGNDYRYSFQGQEKDDEIKGEGNSLNYTFRMHDPRVGRFFAVDPLTKEYPELTPYQFASNSVIDMVEIEGLEGGWIVGSQGQVQHAALGPVNDRYFNWFFDAYSSASLNIQQPSSFNTLRAYARTPSVQVPQAQVREVTIESHQKQHSNHYLAAHDPVMKGIGTGLLAGSTGFALLEGYGAYSAWFGTTELSTAMLGGTSTTYTYLSHQIYRGLQFNSIDGLTNLYGQYRGNNYVIDEKINWFQPIAVTLVKKPGLANILESGVGLNYNKKTGFEWSFLIDSDPNGFISGFISNAIGNEIGKKVEFNTGYKPADNFGNFTVGSQIEVLENKISDAINNGLNKLE